MFRIECHDVGKFYGKTEVFRRVNFRFEGASVIGIQGPNGSGKTTLLKCLAGLLRPSEGTVVWHENGEPIEQRVIRYKIGFTGPYIQMYHELTVLENLTFIRSLRDNIDFPPFASGLPGLMASLEINPLAKRSFGTLSSGQQQRVKLAGALVSSPPILMLDEPGTNLDSDGTVLVQKIVEHQRSSGGMVVLASNRQDELAHCDAYITLSDANPATVPP